MSFDYLDQLKFLDERSVLAAALAAPPLDPNERKTVREEAEALVKAARSGIRHRGVLESFLQEFSLETPEGLALMCLAEALLRTPDERTRDRLIAAKVASADWASHVGQSDSLLVNASTWSLMLTGKLIALDQEAVHDLPRFVRRLANRLGEPVIRHAVRAAVRIMGEQFVLGPTIEQALTRADEEGLLCSFDMLGEAARTQADADRYEGAYVAAVEAVGAHARGRGPDIGHGVSVKLSALSPRYEARQAERVWAELYPRIRSLAFQAVNADINLTLDAEEADRLVLSLEILDRLVREPELRAWKGLGLAVQAYQKRAPQVINAVAKIARSSRRRLMVRLVKGAYWDTEIKSAQVAGLPDYPTYTTKAATDLSYLVCARALIAATPALYPQFATHNAYTLAAVREMARQAGISPEFQRLYGMGEALYGAGKQYDGLALRTYAPVGSHEDLLPYLVRRLLENGANTSFVRGLLDKRTPVSSVVTDPMSAVESTGGAPNSRIPRPVDLYAPGRRNSLGLDLSTADARSELARAIAALDSEQPEAGPIVRGRLGRAGTVERCCSPAQLSHVVGRTWSATPDDVNIAFLAAEAAQPAWDACAGERRAKVLRAMGDALEINRDRLVALCAREAGKILSDGVAEVREATDFCRYYASVAESQFAHADLLKGPVGERNQLTLHGRGVFACISPWNFPLAIFTGQIAAALAAGNAVLAKPAEQTPLIAAEAVRLFHAAGLDPDLLHLLPGDGEVIGAALVTHPYCDGVAFTGGTDTARTINRALASRSGPIVPLIAETGGLNAMFVDTTALREQVIDDVLTSAFGSAGQRCSALRLLFLPHRTADQLVDGLIGGMSALVLGDPADPRTDVGPIIDEQARGALQAHAERLMRDAKVLHQLSPPGGGYYFGPVIAEIPTAEFLRTEVFGPILHVVRYDPDQIETAAAAVRSAGYGLTLGIHTRIEAFAARVQRLVPAGNVYINRSMTGAVVGVQPFGGLGLSGTGPKAGGPHTLLRYAVEHAVSVNIAAQGGDPELLNLS
jgi:RHH-type transcriptional regulator, proline utilization regulon repressor / proline dehydrogenase / delta 1-pyrroline-5-carboxylate dehydrogenase